MRRKMRSDQLQDFQVGGGEGLAGKHSEEETSFFYIKLFFRLFPFSSILCLPPSIFSVTRRSRSDEDGNEIW